MKDLRAAAVFLCLALLMQGCETHLASNQEQHQIHAALDEVRIELADVKHALHAKEVQFALLEEKLSAPAHTKQPAKQQEISSQLSLLERRIFQIEKMQEKTSSDLKHLQTQSGQALSSLTQHKEKMQALEQEISARLGELSKIRSTLSAISQAMGKSSSAPKEGIKKYKVKAGDSLEKIARKEQISVDTLKKLNGLETDRIAIGQELILE